MSTLLGNLRGAVRILVWRPAFALTAVVILGLGIGVNTLIFSITDAVLLRPLPYPAPNQLVWISQGISFQKTEYALAPDFTVWRSQVRSFVQAAAFTERSRNFAGADEPKQILSAEVTAEFLPLLGIRPVAGRGFLGSDDRPGGERVVILSHGFCARHYAGEQNCVGRTITLDDEPFEVVGVLPDHFRFPSPRDVEVITPLALGSEQVSREAGMSAGIRQINAIARLRPDVTLARAQAELDAVQQSIVQSYPQFRDGQKAKLRPLHEHLTAGISYAAMVLWGAVSLLWALGCINVGSLMFARAVSRRTEMAIRMSLGASRPLIFRQVLAENSVLTFLGLILGLFITFWGHSFIVSIFPQKVFGSMSLTLNTRIAAFIVITFALTVLLISMMTVWALPSQSIAGALKSGGVGGIGSLRRRRVLNALVVAEVVLAVTLLVEAGLMLKSYWALRYRDLGFWPEHVLTLRLDLNPSRYPANRQQTAFFENLIQRVTTLPGVDAVALSSSPPPAPADAMFRLSAEGWPSTRTPGNVMVRVQAVNAGYFHVLRIPLVEGQMFSDRERPGGQHVVLVNRALAREYLADEQVIGKKIQLGSHLSPWQTIIGVVEDFKNVGLGLQPEPEVYRPYPQFPLSGSRYLLVRSSTSDPLSLTQYIRKEVRELDRELPIAEVQTLTQRLTASVAQPRFVMSLLVGFAMLALLLATVGVYGIMSFAGRLRAHEIAIRMALGAQPRQVIWLVVREGLLLSLFGAAIGIACASIASRLLSGMLHGVAPSDPYTFVIVLALLLFTAMCSCYLTARKAAKVDPLEALRHD